jgi:uncharacterized membrane protein YoaK (UPF0700 family)
LLTAVTGIVDAVSFLALGHIFTANMTGNVVFLGFAVAGAPGLSIGRSSAALAAFVCGAVGGGALAARLGEGPRRRWVRVGLAVEALLLLGAAALAIGKTGDLMGDPPRLYSLIALTGLAMGVRNAVVRKIGERDLNTTVLTLTITALAADSSLAGGTNPNWKRRTASVALMFAGAVAGALLLRHSVALPLALGGAVSALCALRADAQ